MKPYQALIWNEWRRMRGNILVLTGVTAQLWLLLVVVGCFNKTLVEYIEMIAIALAIGLPLLCGIVLADSLGREFNNKTDKFFLEPPASPAKIFFCKYAANLAVFLALSAVAVLIMSQMIVSQDIDLTSGIYFIDKHLPYRRILLLLGIVILLWTPVHGMVFLVSLSGVKYGNGILAIILTPLLCLLLLPGIMAVTMFFFISDYNWIFPSLRLTLIVLYCFCLGFGWYLWTCRIVPGRKILKPVIVALAAVFLAPWILYGTAYFYFSRSFDAAIREAGAAGLETDFDKLVSPPVPAEQNATPGILKFHSEYKLVYQLYFGKNAEAGKKAPGPLPSQSDYSGVSWTGAGGDSNRRFRRKILPRKTILEISDFMINDPRMNQCCVILSEALKKPYCRFDAARAAGDQYYAANYVAAYAAAANFLSDRAYACRATGRENDFFASLAGIDKLADALTEQPFALLKECGMRLKTIEYQTAVTAGPDTSDAVKFYNEMIRRADSIIPAMPDETFRIHGYLENGDGIIYPEDSIFQTCKFLYPPRLLQSAAAWVRWKIEHDKLLKQALAGTSVKAIEPAIKSLEKIADGIPGVLRTEAVEEILPYFTFRGRFESYKLCLALKVYHVKYGNFPDSLQQLVPEILSKNSINPVTGKDYMYQAETNGFRLFSPANRIRYQTWEIETEKTQ